jgi:hypothetical protein
MQYILTQEELDELKQGPVVWIAEPQEEKDPKRLKAIINNCIHIAQKQTTSNFASDPFAEPQEYFTISFTTDGIDNEFINQLRSMIRK